MYYKKDELPSQELQLSQTSGQEKSETNNTDITADKNNFPRRVFKTQRRFAITKNRKQYYQTRSRKSNHS
jgi:hypothetical protein